MFKPIISKKNSPRGNPDDSDQMLFDGRRPPVPENPPSWPSGGMLKARSLTRLHEGYTVSSPSGVLGQTRCPVAQIKIKGVGASDQTARPYPLPTVHQPACLRSATLLLSGVYGPLPNRRARRRMEVERQGGQGARFQFLRGRQSKGDRNPSHHPPHSESRMEPQRP